MDAFQSERLTSSLSVRPHERDGSQNWLFSPFSSSSRRMKLRGISTPLMIFLFSCRESDDECVVYVFVFVCSGNELFVSRSCLIKMSS